MKPTIPEGDLHSYICWDRRKPYYSNFYLKPDERRELITDVGDSGVLLFEYLLFMANQKDGNEAISDQRIADWFGWTERKAQRYRLALISTGWLGIEKYKGNHNDNYVYFLGKPAVALAAGRASQEEG